MDGTRFIRGHLWLLKGENLGTRSVKYMIKCTLLPDPVIAMPPTGEPGTRPLKRESGVVAFTT